jgi:O-antigen/teichoic acid export membrane protein
VNGLPFSPGPHTASDPPVVMEISKASQRSRGGLLRQALLALVTSSIVAVSLTATSVLITRSLGVTGRGEVAAAVLIPTIIAYIGQFGLPTAVGYWINTEPDQRSVIIGTARTIALILSVVLILVSIGLTLFLPLDDTVRRPAIIFALFIPLNLLSPIDSAVLQADMRAMALNSVRLASSLSYLLFVIAILALHVESTLTMVLAQLGGMVVWLVLAKALVETRPQLTFHSATARSLVSYGLRAHLGTVQPVDTLRIDQLILGLFLSTYALGTYVVAMTFVMANRMIGQSIGLVAFPVASRNDSGVNRKKLLGGLIVGAVALVMFAAVIEIVFGRLLLRVLFDVHSDEAYSVMTVLVVGSVFMTTRQVLSDTLRGLGHPGLPALSELVLLVTLVAFAVSFWGHGLIGVAWAVTISACLAFAFLLAFWVISARSALR